MMTKRWGQCYYGADFNSPCSNTPPIRGQHPEWNCCNALVPKAEWIGDLNDPASDPGTYYWSVVRLLDFNVFDFRGVTVSSKVGVDNAFPRVRCRAGSYDNTVPGSGADYVSFHM
jgi:hypothetical protein